MFTLTSVLLWMCNHCNADAFLNLGKYHTQTSFCDIVSLSFFLNQVNIDLPPLGKFDNLKRFIFLYVSVKSQSKMHISLKKTIKLYLFHIIYVQT